jgi:hypothetical protein
MGFAHGKKDFLSICFMVWFYGLRQAGRAAPWSVLWLLKKVSNQVGKAWAAGRGSERLRG